MNYRDYNDYELLSLIKDDNEEASNILYEKYQTLINNNAKRMLNTNNIGIELNDLIQEGLLGFTQAINTYNEHLNILFYTYAKTCIERRMISYIIASNRNKHKILNEAISFENKINDDLVILDIIADNALNPEELLINEEKTTILLNKFKNVLTDFEYNVLELKISGLNYKEIGNILDKDNKAIDNAIQRMKAKISKLIGR